MTTIIGVKWRTLSKMGPKTAAIIFGMGLGG
jgi:hypothetical protein